MDTVGVNSSDSLTTLAGNSSFGFPLFPLYFILYPVMVLYLPVHRISSIFSVFLLIWLLREETDYVRCSIRYLLKSLLHLRLLLT